MYRKFKHIHMVGILGSGMCGIAELLLNLGYRVSGSDLAVTPVAERLRKLGATIAQGHTEENVKGADVVVFSSAITRENPEVVAARRANIPAIPRAEMLAELMRLKYGIAVGGAHGKTTTTSMIATVLTMGGFDPTIVVGGRLNILGSNAKLGQGDFLVAEADESDGSFLKLSPSIAVVTNIDREHLDYFKNLEQIRKAFLNFIQKVPFYGAAVLCLDDDNVRRLIPMIEKRIITYGLSSQAMIRASAITHEAFNSSFILHILDQYAQRITIKAPGKHNVLNALAAAAVAYELEMPFEQICAALQSFSPPDRRFELKGNIDEVIVIDDYGHHPQELEATLKAARDGWNRRIFAVFQPHRFTRTRDLAAEFYTVFYEADVLIVTDIYPAGEQPIEGIHARSIAEGILQHGHQAVHYIPAFSHIVDFLEEMVRPGDMVITMGAGSVWKIGELLLQRLQANSPSKDTLHHK